MTRSNGPRKINKRAQVASTNPKARPVDVNLFAGGGGLAAGLRLAGLSTDHLYEVDPHACETLRHNAGSATHTVSGEVHQEDVATVDWNQLGSGVRLLSAAVPCQPFSLGGNHKAQYDGRNLFPELFRAIRALRPEAILIENVRGLLRQSFQPYFEYILRQLEFPSLAPTNNEPWQAHDKRLRQQQCCVSYKPDYLQRWRLVDAADFGVPQNRHRVFIVATKPTAQPFLFPAPTHSRQALLHAQLAGTYWDRHGVKPVPLTRNGTSATGLEDGKLPWLTVRDALRDLPKPADSQDTSVMNHWQIAGARSYAGHSGSIEDWPSKAIKAGVHGVPGGENTLSDGNGGIRYYTFREAARIQTFADTHYFKGARLHVTRQLGNAVPCVLVAAVAQNLSPLLTEKLDRD